MISKKEKKCVINWKLKFEYYKNCLEANQLKKEINYQEKNKLAVNSLLENHKEFIKNNTLILKSQQRFRSEKYNVFTEEVNKIPLSAKDDKRTQLVNSV